MSDKRYLHIGGLVAIGFDPSGSYLLAISHSGRGVFSTQTWELIERDSELAYPWDGFGLGIGPINGQLIPVTEINYDNGCLVTNTPDGRFKLEYHEGMIAVVPQV